MDMSEFIQGIDLGEERISMAATVTADQVADAILLPALRGPEAPSPWHARLPFDIALGDDQQVLCDRYNLTPLELEALYYVPAFRREVAGHSKSIREEGVTFRQKAKVQAEMYLEVLDDIVNNVDVSPATRLDAIKSVVKWGDLEPKESKAAGSANMPQFNIQINL